MEKSRPLNPEDQALVRATCEGLKRRWAPLLRRDGRRCFGMVYGAYMVLEHTSTRWEVKRMLGPPATYRDGGLNNFFSSKETAMVEAARRDERDKRPETYV